MDHRQLANAGENVTSSTRIRQPFVWIQTSDCVMPGPEILTREIYPADMILVTTIMFMTVPRMCRSGDDDDDDEGNVVF